MECSTEIQHLVRRRSSKRKERWLSGKSKGRTSPRRATALAPPETCPAPVLGKLPRPVRLHQFSCCFLGTGGSHEHVLQAAGQRNDAFYQPSRAPHGIHRLIGVYEILCFQLTF